MLKQNSYITIQPFMINELGLKGNNLLIYAIIYGFSRDGQGEFKGSLQYLAEWTNTTRRSVLNCLQDLTKRGFINKIDIDENHTHKCHYIACEGVKQSLTEVVKNFQQGGEKSLPEVVKNFQQGGEKFSHDNIIDIIDNTIEEKEKYIKKKNPETKKASVMSEDWQPSKETVQWAINNGYIPEKIVDKFKNACLAKGLKYVNFDRAIKSWNWSKDNDIKITADNAIIYADYSDF